MIGTLDRYILRSLVVNYLIALAVMMSLYVVLDLFFNMDEFTEGEVSAFKVLGGIVSYYGTNLFKYFAQLSGVITVVTLSPYSAPGMGSRLRMTSTAALI